MHIQIGGLVNRLKFVKMHKFVKLTLGLSAFSIMLSLFQNFSFTRISFENLEWAPVVKNADLSRSAADQTMPSLIASPDQAPTQTQQTEAASSNSTNEFQVSINSGGGSIQMDGESWLPDRNFIRHRGVVDRGPIPIADRQNVPDKVYQTEAWCSDGYSFPVKDGNYEVQMHFAETSDTVTGPNQRVFDVVFQESIKKTVDVFAETGGRNRAFVLRTMVTAVGGSLNIGFNKRVNCPMVNGVRLISRSQKSDPFGEIRNSTNATNSNSTPNSGSASRSPASTPSTKAPSTEAPSTAAPSTQQSSTLDSGSSGGGSWSTVALPKLSGYSKAPKLFDRHRTLFLTQEFLDANRDKKTTDSGYQGYPVRYTNVVQFDGAPALKHQVKKGQGVMGIQYYKEWPRVNDFRGVMLRYQTRYTNYREFGGKQITLEGGRGYIGKGYRDGWSSFGRSGPREKFGTEGWAVYSMIAPQKFFFLMAIDKTITASKVGTNEGYGYYPKQDKTSHPLNQWVTIDVVVDMQHGYTLYQDGKKTAWGNDTTPHLKDPRNAKYIHMGVRLMYGGNPGEIIPTRDHDEYYRNSEIFIFD